MVKTEIAVTVLTASDGMALTNGTAYSSNDSVDNWREVPESEVPKTVEGII